MLRSCKYCGRVHSADYVCPYRPKEKKDGRRENRFRSSQAWKRKRAAIQRRDGYLCRVCLLEKTLSKDRYVSQGLSVHHIVPLHEDYARRLDDDNLITLCQKCHDAAEKGEISRATLLRLARCEDFDIPPGVENLDGGEV